MSKMMWLVFHVLLCTSMIYWGVYVGCAVSALFIIIVAGLYFARRKRWNKNYQANYDGTTVVRALPHVVTVQGVVVQPSRVSVQPQPTPVINSNVEYSNLYPPLPQPVIPSAP